MTTCSLWYPYVKKLHRVPYLAFGSKIEKVPRGIRGEKSSKDMASSRNLVSTIGALASPKMGTEPGVRKGKRSLLGINFFPKITTAKTPTTADRQLRHAYTET